MIIIYLKISFWALDFSGVLVDSVCGIWAGTILFVTGICACRKHFRSTYNDGEDEKKTNKVILWEIFQI